MLLLFAISAVCLPKTCKIGLALLLIGFGQQLEPFIQAAEKLCSRSFLAIHIVLDSVWPIYFYSHFIFILENSSMNFVSLFQKYFSVPATFFVGSECFNTEIPKFFENTSVKVIFLLIQQYWKELSNHLTVGLFIVQKHNLFSWTSVI